MPHLYTREDYEALARAVLAGMPESEAEKTLEDQRKKGAKGEEVYWLTLKEGARTAKTSIQVTRGLKAVLDELKLTPRESYQGVIERLITRCDDLEIRRPLSEAYNKEKEEEKKKVRLC